jgi:NAD(P)-dependent dehydrogenase (short-subunit alcohol dehydrogenase family)
MANPGWDARSIPDQSGRTAAVTGATSGIGEETARVAGYIRRALLPYCSVQSLLVTKNAFEHGAHAAGVVYGRGKSAVRFVVQIEG